MGLDSSRVLAVLGGGGSTPGSDFDRSGLVGLLPGKRGPRRPHKITPEVARFIEQTVVRGEELAAQRLVERIAERFGLVVHQRTVKRAFTRLKKKAH
jgi:transposase